MSEEAEFDPGFDPNEELISVEIPRLETTDVVDDFIDKHEELFSPGCFLSALLRGCCDVMADSIRSAFSEENSEQIEHFIQLLFKSWDTRIVVEVHWSDHRLEVNLIGVDDNASIETGWVVGLTSWLSYVIQHSRIEHEWVVSVFAYGIIANASAGRAEYVSTTAKHAEEMRKAEGGTRLTKGENHERKARTPWGYPVEILGLCRRAQRAVAARGARNLAQLTQLSEAELLAESDFGFISLNDVRIQLAKFGLQLMGETKTSAAILEQAAQRYTRHNR